MYRWYGWGTFVCQDCRRKKNTRNSKRCKPCNYKSKEWAEIHREIMKRRFEDPKERVRQGEIVKIALNRPGVKETLREAQKKRYEKPAERVKLSKILKKRYEDPHLRLKLSRIMKKHYEDPKERERQSEAIRRGLMKRKQVGGDHGDQIS